MGADEERAAVSDMRRGTAHRQNNARRRRRGLKSVSKQKEEQRVCCACARHAHLETLTTRKIHTKCRQGVRAPRACIA